MFSKRSLQDELMLRYLGNPLIKLDPDYFYQYHNSLVTKTHDLLICDARSKTAAFGNKIMGKGYESDKFYKNTKLSFHSIANLDGVVSSYNMITEK